MPNLSCCSLKDASFPGARGFPLLDSPLLFFLQLPEQHVFNRHVLPPTKIQLQRNFFLFTFNTSEGYTPFFWLHPHFNWTFWMVEENERTKLSQRVSERRRREPGQIAVTEAALSGKSWTGRELAARVTAENREVEKIEARL